MRKKEIMTAIQTRLKTQVAALKYIDKDWGQLDTEYPAVNWPCCLIDIESVDYDDGRAVQVANAVVVLTVANQRTAASSADARSAQVAEAYSTVDLVETIDTKLHLFTNGNFAPLVRRSFKRIAATTGYECYQVTYLTAYKCNYPPNTVLVQATPVINAEFDD